MPRFILFLLLLPASAFAQPLDLVFVLDTTGSMGGEIREAKDRIRELSDALRKSRPGKRIRVGVVAYRDKGDAYLTRASDLSDDVESSYRFIAGLSADGGGDSPEDVLAGLDHALSRISWDSSAATERQIFIIADAPPHLDYTDRRSTEDLVREAIKRRIAINVIGCRSLSGTGIQYFRQLAYSAEGSYQHIGRVQADDGLADAMLEALSPRTPEDISRHPQVRLILRPPGERVARTPGLAVFPWESGSGASKACGIQVEVPHGYDLAATPDVRLGPDAMHVALKVAPGQGRVHRYALERCVAPATPILVHLGE